MNKFLGSLELMIPNAPLVSLAVNAATNHVLGAAATRTRCTTEPGSGTARVAISAAASLKFARDLSPMLKDTITKHVQRFGSAPHAPAQPVEIHWLSAPRDAGSSGLFLVNLLTDTFLTVDAWQPVDFTEVISMAAVIPGTAMLGEKTLLRAPLTEQNLAAMSAMARRAEQIYGQRVAMFPVIVDLLGRANSGQAPGAGFGTPPDEEGFRRAA